MTPAVDQIMALMAEWGDRPYDEEIGQRFHAEQTAAAAVAAGADESLVAAALLHDLGHLLAMVGGIERPASDEPDARHEARGARVLATAFPPSVTRPIALHVAAKRYLVATEPAYAASLSAGSASSLAVQGGASDPDECRRFERLEGAADAIRLRRWDDAAKQPDAHVPDVAAYAPILEQLVSSSDARLSI